KSLSSSSLHDEAEGAADYLLSGWARSCGRQPGNGHFAGLISHPGGIRAEKLVCCRKTNSCSRGGSHIRMQQKLPAWRNRRLTPTFSFRSTSPDPHAARPQQGFLYCQVVLRREVARLLPADDSGHVGRIGDVALVLRELQVLIAPLVLAPSGRECHPGR